MIRTPVIVGLPKVLIRDAKPERTPVVHDQVMRPVQEMLARPNLTQADIDTVVEMSGAVAEHDPAWAQMATEALRQSCALFAAEKLRGPKAEPYNGRFILGSHHMEWDELAFKKKRLNILAARDHGKSFFWTFAYPIWRARYWKGSLIYIFSATQQLAESFLKMIKDEILENPELADMIPTTGDRFWSAKEIKTRHGSVIRARGYGVKVRGGHPDFIVCDDCLGDDDIYSETIRRKNIDYFLSSIANMVVPDGQIVVVGTPMHQGDLYAALASTKAYTCRKFPALVDGKALFPERYSIQALEAKKQELKSAARFAREFMCEPLSDEASLFPSKLFEGGDVRLPYVLGLPAAYWEKQGCLRYSGVDIAMSAEVGADWFWIFTLAVDRQGVRWIANLRRGKGWSFTRQIDEIKDEFYMMRPEVIHIEANQAQRVWSDEITRTTSIPVRRFFTTGVGGRQPLTGWKKGATQIAVNKHHLDRGVPSLRMGLEGKKWRIPRGDARSIELTDIWMGEMSAMGWIDGKVSSVAEHDDSVMACWMADTAVRMGSASFGWLEDAPEARKPILSAPRPAEMGIPQEGLLDAERRALAAVQQGQHVDCTADQYAMRVRNALQSYAGEMVDSGQNVRAVVALEEVRRLDKLLRHDLGGSRLLDNADSASYGQPSLAEWKPSEGSPTPQDLGLTSE